MASDPRPAALGTVLAAVFAFYLWTATSGTWPAVFRPADRHMEDPWAVGLDNTQVEGWLAGHLYLPVLPRKELLELPDPYEPNYDEHLRVHDGSLYKGKYYLSWGPTPSLLLFLPFRLLTGRYFPENLAAVLFSAMGVGAGVATLLFLRDRHWGSVPGWMVLAGVAALGLSNVAPFVLRRPRVYEVSISCIYAMMGAAIYCFVSGGLGEKVRLRRLAAGSLLLGLAAGSRATLLFGVVFPTLAGWRLLRAGPQRALRLASLFGPFAVVVGLLGLYNYLRFDSPAEFGYRYCLTSHENMPKYKTFNAARIPPGLHYLFLEPPEWSAKFPFWRLQPKRHWEFEEKYFLEPVAGVLRGIPFLNLLFLLPLLWGGLWKRAPEGCAAIAGLVGLGVTLPVVISAVQGPTMRFELYFAGLLVMAALLVWFELWRRRPSRWIGRGGAALLGYGMLFNICISFTGYDDSLRAGSPRVYGAMENLAAQLLTMPSRWGSQLRMQADRWVTPPCGSLELELEFQRAAAGTGSPLVVTGVAGAADIVFARYVEPEAVVFGWDHWGSPLVLSAPVRIVPGQTHRVEVHMGSLYPVARIVFERLFPGADRRQTLSSLAIRVDGQEVLRRHGEFYPASGRQVSVGENRIGATTSGPRFEGHIREIRRIPPPQQ